MGRCWLTSSPTNTSRRSLAWHRTGVRKRLMQAQSPDPAPSDDFALRGVEIGQLVAKLHDVS